MAEAETAGHKVGSIEEAGLREAMTTISAVAGQSYLATIWREVVADQVELSGSSLQDQQQQVDQVYQAVKRAATDKYR